MPRPIDEARGNGYTDDQINDFLTPRIAAAHAAGYSQDQINQYLGIKTPEPFDPSSVGTMGKTALASSMTPVSNFEDALAAGWGMSVTGLANRPATKTLAEDAPAASRMAFNLAQMAGDVPAYIGGALAGGGLGVETGPGAVITAGAGAMALPTALRGLMMDAYAKGQFNNFSDFWERIAPVMADTAKSYITGAATAGAGIGARAVLPEALPGLLRTGGVTAAELATMVTVGKGLEGEMPRARDFADAAVMLGGMKFGEYGAGKLRNIFTKTGVPPARVVQDATQDVTVQQDLLSDREIPRRYEDEMGPGGNAPFPEGQPDGREPVPEPPDEEEPPVAGEPGRATPGANLIEPLPPEPQRLVSYLIAAGGLRSDRGDVLSSMGGYKGRPGLLSGTGRTIDDATLNAWQDGFFPNHSERPEPRDLLNAIDEDLKGNPQYSHYNEAALRAFQDARAANNEMVRLAAEVGLPTKGMTREQLLDTVAWHLSPEDFDARVGAEEERAAGLYEEAERQASFWLADHASPHTFDRFDTAHIGTGEGAQAFGHGLYFSEADGTHTHYLNTLARREDDDDFKFDGEGHHGDEIGDFDKAHGVGAGAAIDRMIGTGFRQDMARGQLVNDLRSASRWVDEAALSDDETIREDLANYAFPESDEPFDKIKAKITPEMIAEHRANAVRQAEGHKAAAEAALDWFDANKDRITPPELGKVNSYGVMIHAEPHEMLDWDKPLSEQPAEVKAAFRHAGFTEEEIEGGYTGATAYQELAARFAKNRPEPEDPEGAPPGWGAVAGRWTFDGEPIDPVAASAVLHEGGLKGIRYNDAMSRQPRVSVSLDGERYEVPYRLDAAATGEGQAEARAMSHVIGLHGNIDLALTDLEGRGDLGAAAWLRRAHEEGRIGVEKEEGSRNTVVFNHEDVEITHRNGEPVEPHKPTEPELHDLQAGQEPHGGFDAEHFYGADQGRSLEDLEHEYQQEAAAPATGQRPAGEQPGGSAAGDQGGVSDGVQPGGSGAGAAGRTPTQGSLPDAGGGAGRGGGSPPGPTNPAGAGPAGGSGGRPFVNPWGANPAAAGSPPFNNPWGPTPRGQGIIPLVGGGGGRYGGTPPPPGPPGGGQGNLPLPPSPMTPQAARAAILSHLSIGESAPGRPWSFARIYTDLFNRFFPIEQAVTRIAGSNVLPAAEDAGKLARMMAGSTGIADRFSNYHTLDFNTRQPNGEGLRPILDRVTDLDGFRAYLASERALELEAAGIETGFDLDAARHVVANGLWEFGGPAEALYAYNNRLTAYLRDSGVLSRAGHDAMTQKWAAYVPFQRVMDATASGDLGQRVSSSLQAQRVIRGIVGSERVVIDPIESIVGNTYLYTHMAERNMVGTTLIDMLRPHDEAEHIAAQTAAAAQGLNPLAAFDPGGPPKPDEIRIFRDGQAETYRVDPEIAIAVKGLDAPNMGVLERMIRPFAQVLRAGAVLNPDFMLRHTIRDYLYAAATHPDAVKGFSPQMMLRGFMSEIGKDADYQEWLSSGGANVSMISLDRGYLQMTVDDLTDTGLTQRAWNVVSDPNAAPLARVAAGAKLPVQAFRQFILSPLQWGVNLVESASHLGTFIEARREMLAQMPPGSQLSKEQLLEAAYQSRDVAVDAARMGSQIRVYNAIKAFSNIALQDSDRVVRAFVNKPMSTALKIAGAIVLPSVLTWINGKDDPRYEDAPIWERDLFWVLPTDRWRPATQQETIGLPQHLVRSVDGQLEINHGQTWRIPKPWGMGLVFGSGTERLLDGFTARNPNFARDFAKSLSEVSVPIGAPDAAVPIIEQYSNRSLFTNRTLVPSQMEGELPEYQYTPYTSETAKALGKLVGAFPGISPLKTSQAPLGGVARALSSPMLLENYLRGWTGNLGLYALQAADYGLRKSGALPDPVQPTSTLSDIPVIKAFAVRYPGTGVESIQQFEDAYDANKMAFDTWKRMAAEGNQEALDHIRKTEAPAIASAEMTPINETLLRMGKGPLSLDTNAEKRLTEPLIRSAADTRTEAQLSAARAQITGARVNTNMPITLQQMADIRSVLTEHSQLVRDIYKNNDIPADEKRQLIDSVYYRMQELAQIGMAGVRRAEGASSGATVSPAYSTTDRSHMTVQ